MFSMVFSVEEKRREMVLLHLKTRCDVRQHSPINYLHVRWPHRLGSIELEHVNR